MKKTIGPAVRVVLAPVLGLGVGVACAAAELPVVASALTLSGAELSANLEASATLITAFAG